MRSIPNTVLRCLNSSIASKRIRRKKPRSKTQRKQSNSARSSARSNARADSNERNNMAVTGQIKLMQNSGTGKSETTSAVDTKPLSGEVFGALINLSGRRRFTSQRLVLYAVLASQGHEGATTIAREALVKGSDTVPGIFCEEVREAYFGRLDGDAQIVYFINLAERTLNAIDNGLRDAPALLDELVRITTPMLSVLNQITSVYEEQSKRHALLMKKQLRGIMTDIETIAKQAKMVSFNARIVAARAGQAGKEFSVVAGVLSNITTEIDDLVKVALSGAAA